MPLSKQVAALPIRRLPGGRVEVLLVTSRETGRWVIPKGWPSARFKDSDQAAREAKQEAGVQGKISSKPIGAYRYRKVEGDTSRLVYVTVYLLRVEKEKKNWLEKDQRQRMWFNPEMAARRVREIRLSQLILDMRAGRRPPAV